MTLLLFWGHGVKGQRLRRSLYCINIIFLLYHRDVRHWFEYIKPNIYASANEVAGFKFVQLLIMHSAEAYISTTRGRISI